jgi:hypothetical protein
MLLLLVTHRADFFKNIAAYGIFKVKLRPDTYMSTSNVFGIIFVMP